jgi:hypothetical protein
MSEHVRGLEPTGWQDRSAYRFLAPEQKQMVGHLMAAQLPNIRAQMSITWESVDEEASLADLMVARPLPFGVTHVSTGQIVGTPPQLRRVFRFSDPLHGWLIQQSQTFIKEGNRLYVVLLTADPLHFTAAEKTAHQSSRIVHLILDDQCD